MGQRGPGPSVFAIAHGLVLASGSNARQTSIAGPALRAALPRCPTCPPRGTIQTIVRACRSNGAFVDCGCTTTVVPAVAVLAGALGVGQAIAAGSKPSVAAPPSFYTLKNAKARCRAHYAKESVTIRVRRHHRSLALRQMRCVYVGAGSSLGATVSFPNLPTAAVNVSVIPGALDDSYSMAAGQTLDVGGTGVLANDDGSALSAVLLSGTTHGALTLNRAGSFRYTPANGFSGVERFTYRTTDSSGESSTPATVTIHVTPVLGPVGAYELPAAATLSVGAPGVLAGALGSAMRASLVSAVSNGSLTVNADGSFTYTPAPGFSGSDSFTFKAVDGAGQSAGTGTVAIVVDAAGSAPVVPKAPSVVAQNFAGAVGNTLLQIGGTRGGGPEVYRSGASALVGDSDPNGGTLSTTPATIATVQGGSVALAADGTFTYQPPVGFTGPSDSFTYQVDTSEGTSAQADRDDRRHQRAGLVRRRRGGHERRRELGGALPLARRGERRRKPGRGRR